jgi:hypothetical protein
MLPPRQITRSSILAGNGCLLRFCLTVTLALSVATGVRGQEAAPPAETNERDEIETDRDSFTFATSTVGPQATVVESSYSFIDNRLGPESHSFPELLVRRGISDWFELRIGWNYEAGGPGTISGNEVGGQDLQVETEGRILYGAKFLTSNQSGWIPQSSLIVEGYTPTAGPSSVSTVDIGQSFGWTLPNGWVWNSALRFATANEKGDSFEQWAPSTVLKIPIGERWNVHAEYFGIVSYGKQTPINDQFVSFGGHVLLNPNLELGVRFGFGLNRETPDFFNNVGFGWRF